MFIWFNHGLILSNSWNNAESTCYVKICRQMTSVALCFDSHSWRWESFCKVMESQELCSSANSGSVCFQEKRGNLMPDWVMPQHLAPLSLRLTDELMVQQKWHCLRGCCAVAWNRGSNTFVHMLCMWRIFRNQTLYWNHTVQIQGHSNHSYSTACS